jgi:hypothetical protein
MARTVRTKRKSDKKVKDGTDQYASRSCRHHGSCSYCRNNRLFNFIKLNQDKLYEGQMNVNEE